MDDKKLIYELFKEIKTVDEAENFSDAIGSILSSFFKVKNKDIDEILSKTVGKSYASLIKGLLRSSTVSNSDFASANKVLSKVQLELKNAKTLKITLAIDPAEEVVSNIYSWVEENIGSGILLDIEKDESILGGAIIAMDGKYKDFSVRKSLENIFLDKKIDFTPFLLNERLQ